MILRHANTVDNIRKNPRAARHSGIIFRRRSAPPMSSKWEIFKAISARTGKSLASAVLEYDTPKIVHVKNKTVGIINRLVQLAIIGYILG